MSKGEVLERAINANPDDLGAHAAYADWLIEQGDPRGEFIQVQLALEDPTKNEDERRILKAREMSLLREHGLHWLGGLAPFLTEEDPVAPLGKLQFARGWLHRLQVVHLTEKLATVLGNTDQIGLLQQLDIERLGTAEAVACLCRSSKLSNIRVLNVGAEDVSLVNRALVNRTPFALELIRKLPKLTELVMREQVGNMREVFALKCLRCLTVLEVQVETGFRETDPALEALASNPAFGSLKHLRLCGHPTRADGRLQVPHSGLRAFLESPNFRSLTHLTLRHADIGDDACDLIAKSDLFASLRILDLSHDRIGDRGAGQLAAAETAKSLDELCLSGNPLSEAGLSALRRAGVTVTFERTRVELTDADFNFLHDDDSYEGDWE